MKGLTLFREHAETVLRSKLQVVHKLGINNFFRLILLNSYIILYVSHYWTSEFFKNSAYD